MTPADLLGTPAANPSTLQIRSDEPWILQEGDSIGFGGPETIMARREAVSNPFIFRFYPPSVTEGDSAAEAPAPRRRNDVEVRCEEWLRYSIVSPALRHLKGNQFRNRMGPNKTRARRTTGRRDQSR